MPKRYNSIYGLVILISIVLIYIYFNKTERFQTNVKDYVYNQYNMFANILKNRGSDFNDNEYIILEQINSSSYPQLYNKLKNLSEDKLHIILKEIKKYFIKYNIQNFKLPSVNETTSMITNYLNENNL